MKIETYLLYENRLDVSLTGYIIDDSNEMIVGSERPAIIICPGGAYTICSDREAEPIALKFAGMGFHTFVLKYSVIHGIENKWPEEIIPLPSPRKEVQYPMPIIEVGRSMLWIKKHAKEWHLDKEQIGICGFSAGGHNAAMYASCWNSREIIDKLKVAKEDLKPAFCILGYPFVDFELQYNDNMEENIKNSYKWMYIAYFGEVDPPIETMRKYSANYCVNMETCPMFIWTTSTDQGVNPRHAIQLAMACADNNIPYEIHMFGTGQHGLALADRVTASKPEDINITVSQWIPLVEDWLKRMVSFKRK